MPISSSGADRGAAPPVASAKTSAAHVTPRKETFAGVQDAAGMLRPGALHCKVDITEAYRALPMEPEWWKRHCFEWGGVVYSDLRMPFWE